MRKGPFTGALDRERSVVHALGFSGNGVAPSALILRILGRQALGVDGRRHTIRPHRRATRAASPRAAAQGRRDRRARLGRSQRELRGTHSPSHGSRNLAATAREHHHAATTRRPLVTADSRRPARRSPDKKQCLTQHECSPRSTSPRSARARCARPGSTGSPATKRLDVRVREPSPGANAEAGRQRLVSPRPDRRASQ